MKIKHITPNKYIVKVLNYTQYYNKDKMLQVKWQDGKKISKLVDLVSGKIKDVN